MTFPQWKLIKFHIEHLYGACTQNNLYGHDSTSKMAVMLMIYGNKHSNNLLSRTTGPISLIFCRKHMEHLSIYNRLTFWSDWNENFSEWGKFKNDVKFQLHEPFELGSQFFKGLLNTMYGCFPENDIVSLTVMSTIRHKCITYLWAAMPIYGKKYSNGTEPIWLILCRKHMGNLPI